MAEDKEIQKQVKEGLADLKEATKQGVTSVSQEAKKAIADIKQQAKDSVAKATEQIDKKTEKSVQQIDKTTEKATQSVEKATAQSIKDINSATKDSVKDIQSTAKDSVKDIQSTAKDSVKDIKTTTKDSVKDIQSTAKDSVKDIENTTKDSVKDIQSTAKDSVKDIENTTKDSVKDIKTTTKDSVKDIKTATKYSVKDIKTTTKDSVKDIKTTTEDSVKDVKNITQEVAEEFKKHVEKLQDQLDEKLADSKEKQTEPSNDLTTKILQNILSEIKILRKVTEGSVSFNAKSGRYRDVKSGRYVKEENVREQKDNKKEESEKEKKRKGFFTSIKDKFAKPKDDSKNKLTPAKQEGDGTQEKSSLFTNPLVLAGLLALVAPKEVLAFLKGFLGELLFGEESSKFLAGFIAFIAIWKTMKFVKALGNFLKILKPIAWIGRFLFMHPAIALIIGLVTGAYQLIKDFREKYGKRMERKALEDELKDLEQKQYADTEEGKAERQKDEARKQEINKQLEEYSKQGIFTTQGQAREYALKNSIGKIDENHLSGQQKDGIDLIVKYDEAVERFKEKQKKLKPGEGLKSDPDFKFIRDYGGLPEEANSTSEINPKARDQLFNDAGFKTPALKEQAENIIRKRRGLPTLESKPTATATQPQQDAETASQNQRELNRTATGSSTDNVGRSSDAVPATASSTPASSAPTPESKPAAASASNVAPSTPTPVANPDGTSQNQNLPNAPSQGVEEKPQLQPITPSSGETINTTSVAVDAEYQQPPEDTISVMNNDTTKIAKPSNAINSMPGIFADRSYFSQFEIFNNNQFSTLSSAGAGDG